MDTPLRSLAKALTWQASGLLMMTAITWFLTGSLATGGAVAGLGAVTGAAAYVLHERAWARIRWGLETAQRLAAADEAGRHPHL